MLVTTLSRDYHQHG